MYSIPRSEPGVTLHAISRTALYFPSRRELYRHLGWRVLCRFVGLRLDATVGHYFTITDSNDNSLLARDFADLVPRKPLVPTRRTLLAIYMQKRALPDQPASPIPGTGRRRGGNAYRRPRTQAERRANLFVDQDSGEPRPRGARSWKSLACHWDDLVRSDYRMRSWKQYRRHQWKA